MRRLLRSLTVGALLLGALGAVAPEATAAPAEEDIAARLKEYR